MEYFCLLFFVSILLAFVGNQKTKVRMAWLPFLLMLLLLGLRAKTVGTDTSAYINEYVINDISNRTEPLFVFVSVLCHFLDMSPHGFIFFTAFLTIFPLFVFAVKHSVNPCLSALIYLSFSVTFYPQAFNGIRQMIAISFAIYSLYYFDKGKLLKSGIFLIVSSLFHYTCLLLLPFMILFKIIKSTNKLVVYILLFSSFVFGITFGQTDFFIGYFEMFSMISDSDVMNNYANYANDDNVSSLNMVGTLARMLPFMLYSVLLYDSKTKYSFSYMLLLIGAVMSNTFISVHYTYRLVSVFLIPILYMLPETMSKVKGVRRLSLMTMNLLMLIWFFYGLLNSGKNYPNGIFPYSFCF